MVQRPRSSHAASSLHNREEKKKTVIDISFQRALIRGLIHIFPVFICVLLITLNLKGVYIGPALEFGSWTTTYSLAAFQVAAKVQELLAIASMTVIVFDIIRHQLLHREGLPLGLLSAGFTFSRFDFFCSRATWIWLGSVSAKKERILVMLAIIIIALLGLVIGPASAVLMLPRVTNQVVYSPTFSLNGTTDDLFPTTLTAAHIGGSVTTNASDPHMCMQSDSFTNDHCISRAYQKMQTLLDSAPGIAYWDWTLIVRETIFARLVTVHEHIETWARAPHVATGYVQYMLWWDPTWFNKRPEQRVSSVRSKAPNVRTACLWQTISMNTSGVDFPNLQGDSVYLYDSNASISVPSGFWSQGNESFIDPDLVRTVWIDGAQSIEAVTAGIVVLAPLANTNDTSRTALACSIDARWDESNHVQADGPLDIAISADAVGTRPDDSGGSEFLPANNSDWTNIKADMDWLEALTPSVPYLSQALQLTSPASTFANLFMSTGHTSFPPISDFENRYAAAPYQFWEMVIATYFAEGVARVGYSQQLASLYFFIKDSEQGMDQCFSPVDDKDVWHNLDQCPEPGVNTTSFALQGEITGVYAYRASATTDYVSIGILFAYICIATAHLFYNLIRRRSSRAWERPEDLLALAHSSRPEPDILFNTCAGIENPHTRAKNLRIVGRGGRNIEMGGHEDEEAAEAGKGHSDRKDHFDQDEEELQLVFVDGVRDGAIMEEVRDGVKYGKVD